MGNQNYNKTSMVQWVSVLNISLPLAGGKEMAKTNKNLQSSGTILASGFHQKPPGGLSPETCER